MKRHRRIGTILVIVGVVYGLGLAWLYFSLQPQFNVFAEYERKHTLEDAPGIRSSNFFSSQPEILSYNSRFANPNPQPMTEEDLVFIQSQVTYDWVKRDWLSRSFLSIVGYFASVGGSPSDFARPGAMWPGLVEVILLLLIGCLIIANPKRKATAR